MSSPKKSHSDILKKLGIASLNPMQKEASAVISSNDEVILLSPTGTGKTLAFLLPILDGLDAKLKAVQVLILVPSRELAIQIEQVARNMGSGLKITAVYGGRSGVKDKKEFKNAPTILIGTPGRVADHLRRENVEVDSIKTLILDEFDKSLEIGFEKEMKEIVSGLPSVKKKILTSATTKVDIPSFLGLSNPIKVNYLDDAGQKLRLVAVKSPSKDKLDTLVKLLSQLNDKNGIVFCNFKDTIEFVSDYLYDHKISHGCFYGGLEQRDRERALIKFRNGTDKVLLATDLAARGIDVPEMDYIIHYQIPSKEDEFIHRNGRTARMHSEGVAYLLIWENDKLHDFIKDYTYEEFSDLKTVSKSNWQTLFISGGRKDKISKGDIAGLFFKQGDLNKNELGLIELKQDCAFVAVPRTKVKSLVSKLNNVRLKKKKVRISLID